MTVTINFIATKIATYLFGCALCICVPFFIRSYFFCSENPIAHLFYHTQTTSKIIFANQLIYSYKMNHFFPLCSHCVVAAEYKMRVLRLPFIRTAALTIIMISELGFIYMCKYAQNVCVSTYSVCGALSLFDSFDLYFVIHLEIR